MADDEVWKKNLLQKISDDKTPPMEADTVNIFNILFIIFLSL